MPKKKSRTKKTENKKDKILEEISEKLKEIKNKETEEESKKSGLEEDTDLSTLEFNQFIPSLHFSEDTKIPVLEKVASEQPRPVFVGGIPQTPQTIPGEEKELDDVKYVPARENGEPKYIESEERISREPERVDFSRIGREPERLIPKSSQEAFFMHSELRQPESFASEKMWAAERNDFERAGREDPFEKEERKYEKYKSKMPKGY